MKTSISPSHCCCQTKEMKIFLMRCEMSLTRTVVLWPGSQLLAGLPWSTSQSGLLAAAGSGLSVNDESFSKEISSFHYLKNSLTYLRLKQKNTGK